MTPLSFCLGYSWAPTPLNSSDCMRWALHNFFSLFHSFSSFFSFSNFIGYGSMELNGQILYNDRANSLCILSNISSPFVHLNSLTNHFFRFSDAVFSSSFSFIFLFSKLSPYLLLLPMILIIVSLKFKLRMQQTLFAHFMRPRLMCSCSKTHIKCYET